MSDARDPLLRDSRVLLWAERPRGRRVIATPRARLPRMSVVGRTIGGMRTLEICERCDGTGADPTQHSEEITLCVECSGDGCHVTYYVELAQTA